MILIALLASLLRSPAAMPACAQPPLSNAAAERLSLEEAIRLAVQNNATLLSAEQDMLIAQYRVKEATFLFFPQTGLSGTFSKSDLKYPVVLPPEFGSRFILPSAYENFYTARASLLQAVYTGGRNTNTRRMAQTSLKQARTRYEAVKREVILDVKNVFYRVIYCVENSRISREWLQRMEKAAKASAFRGWEEIEAKALLSRMESETEKADQELNLARLDLLKALNRELDSPVEISGELKSIPVKMDINQSTVWAMELRPELKSEVYKAQLDAIAVNLALSRRSPTVYLGASYDLIGNNLPLRTNSWETSLSIHFPLAYNFWTQIQQKRAEQRQGDIKRSELQDKVRLEVRQAYENLDFWQKEAAKRSSVWTELSGQYSAAGQPSSIAAVRAINALYENQKKFIEGIKEQLLAKAALEWAVGRDLASE